ncbi:hypothetical protein FJY84_06145 [Candidatus Bathyarchaeota archaeon]|nr:hypothetical protein [Candidatus Bathyarchaeota archaeon]
MLEEFIESPEGLELSSLCIDLGYKLAESPADLTRSQIDFLISALSHRMRQANIASQPIESGSTRIVFE